MQDSPELQRITTQYVATEDRIRLSGETADGQTVVLWLTQRFLNLLAPRLTDWLEQNGAATPDNGLLQEFAQQAAEGSLGAEPAVDAASPIASWRVVTIDVSTGTDGVTLTLKSDDDASETARLPLPTHALRQWLAIVRNQFIMAGWPTSAWPAWMEEARVAPTKPATFALH